MHSLRMNLSSLVRTVVYLYGRRDVLLCNFVVVRQAVFSGAGLLALLAADAQRGIVKNSLAHELTPGAPETVDGGRRAACTEVPTGDGEKGREEKSRPGEVAHGQKTGFHGQRYE